MGFVLFHSPLVGPTTWRWVAASLMAEGHEVAVPDLRSCAVEGDRDVVVSAAAGAVPYAWSSTVLVGHSGFGSLLPSVAELLGGHPAMVFVDAGLPPCEGRATASGDFLDHLRRLAVDGVLPKWSTWWGAITMERLVPDADRRAEIEAEMPNIPLALFESGFEVPAGWCRSRGSYVLLSDPYRDDAERARSLGWTIVERLGTHLEMVNDPDGIAEAIVGVTS